MFSLMWWIYVYVYIYIYTYAAILSIYMYVYTEIWVHTWVSICTYISKLCLLSGPGSNEHILCPDFGF